MRRLEAPAAGVSAETVAGESVPKSVTGRIPALTWTFGVNSFTIS